MQGKAGGLLGSITETPSSSFKTSLRATISCAPPTPTLKVIVYWLDASEFILFATKKDTGEERRKFEAEKKDPDLVFRRYFDQIYRYCRQRVATDADAEDVCAQVFAEAIKSLPKLKWKGSPVLAFLYTVAGRRLIDRARREKEDVSDVEAMPEPAAKTPSVEILAQKGALGRAIGDLPEDQRLCVYLQVVQGYSFAEVAEIAGRSEKACKGLVYRGLEQVRGSLEKEGVSPG